MSEPRPLAQASPVVKADLMVAEARQTLRLAVVIPALVVGALCALLAWQVRALSEHSRWVAHSHEVIGQTWRVEKLLLDQETGLRARLLTGDDAFLAPYVAARAELPAAFDRLSALVADNPRAVERIAELRARHAGWLRNAEESIARAGAAATIVTPELREEMKLKKEAMDGMRGVVGAMITDEDRLLEERRASASRASRRLFVAGGGAALFLALVAAISLRRLVRSLDESYAQALVAQSEALRVSEMLAGEVTEQLDQAMASILQARAAHQAAEERIAKLKRGEG